LVACIRSVRPRCGLVLKPPRAGERCARVAVCPVPSACIGRPPSFPPSKRFVRNLPPACRLKKDQVIRSVKDGGFTHSWRLGGNRMYGQGSPYCGLSIRGRPADRDGERRVRGPWLQARPAPAFSACDSFDYGRPCPRRLWSTGSLSTRRGGVPFEAPRPLRPGGTETADFPGIPGRSLPRPGSLIGLANSGSEPEAARRPRARAAARSAQ
jgi:hypothetical protein